MPATATAHDRSASTSKTLVSTVFRKNAGAVQIWNSISVLQRKAFGVLLVNAYEELPDFGILTHEIPVRVLAHHAGFNSNNTQYLKDALTGLVTTPLHWNIQRVDGREAWAVSATLASARIEDGVVYYAFSPELRRRLYNPEVYAQLDLAVIRAFKSGYALALYENCKLFAVAGETPDFTPNDLRGLLGAGDTAAYENFGRFMDKVLKPATSEVNRVSELSVEPVLTREARRVTAVKFKIRDNSEKIEGIDQAAQSALTQNALRGRDVDLFMAIQAEIGVGYAQLLKVFEEHADGHLRAVFEYTKQRERDGKIAKGKRAGYFLTVVKRAEPGSLIVQQPSLDLPAPREPSEQERAAAAAEEAQRDARRQAILAAEQEWKALSPEGQEALHAQFMDLLATNNRTVYNTLRKGPLQPGTMAYRLLLEWMIDRGAKPS